VGNQEFQKAACTFCGGNIEYPATAAGMTVECPHCHQQTELQSVQKAGRGISSLLLYTVLGIALAAGALLLLKARKPEQAAIAPVTSSPVASNSNAAPVATPVPRPKSVDDLKLIGGLSVGRARGSRLSYAMGTLTNDSDHQRYGVRVEVDLFDEAGNKLPQQANDYLQMLEPRKEWKFRALVLETKAVKGKVAAIKEEE
jgi:hypothetical protein